MINREACIPQVVRVLVDTQRIGDAGNPGKEPLQFWRHLARARQIRQAHAATRPQHAGEFCGSSHFVRKGAEGALADHGIKLAIGKREAQEILGHSQISMTMDTYSYVLPTMQREAMSKLNDALQG